MKAPVTEPTAEELARLIERLRELDERATKGPWLASGRAMTDQTVTTPHPDLGLLVIAKIPAIAAEHPHENAALIAHVRTHLPEIIATLKFSLEMAQELERRRDQQKDTTERLTLAEEQRDASDALVALAWRGRCRQQRWSMPRMRRLNEWTAPRGSPMPDTPTPAELARRLLEIIELHRVPATPLRQAAEALSRLSQAEQERDLAIAHDRQPYPTTAAYEAVCAARSEWQERAEKAEQERDASDAALHELRKLYGAITDDLTMDPRYPWENAPQAYKDAWRRVRDLLIERHKRSRQQRGAT